MAAVSGAVAWVQRSIGNNVDQAATTAVTTSGALVVGGSFAGNDQFAPGTAGSLTLNSKAGSADFYLARYDSNGHLVWLKTGGSSATDDGVGALAAAQEDGTFAGGTHGNGTDDFVIGAGEPSETHFTLNGLFFARHRADGSLVWAKSTAGNHF